MVYISSQRNNAMAHEKAYREVVVGLSLRLDVLSTIEESSRD